jgi:WD40 repeat protein
MIIYHRDDFSVVCKIDAVYHERPTQFFQTSTDQFLIGLFNGNIHIWDYNNDNIRDLSGHNRPVLSIFELKSGNFVSGSKDKSLRIWAPSLNYACVYVFDVGAYVMGAFLIDGDFLAVRSFEAIGIMNIYDQNSIVVPFRKEYITCVRLLQDKNIAVGCEDGSITVLGRVKYPHYKILFILKEHQKRIRFLLTYKYNTIITGSTDKIIIRDLNRNFRPIVVFDLNVNFLDHIIFLEDEIFYNEMSSFNKIKLKYKGNIY